MGITISTPYTSGTATTKGEIGASFAIMVGGITLMSFFWAGAGLAGVLQVPGNPMGPAVAHRGAVDQCLRNLNGGGGAIGACTRAGNGGAGADGTRGGTGRSGGHTLLARRASV